MKLSTVLAAISADHIRQTSLPGADVQLYQACFLTSTSSAFTASTLYVAPTSVYLALPCHQAPSLFLLIPMGWKYRRRNIHPSISCSPPR